MPTVSVIVPFHRNLQHLARCLEAACLALNRSDPSGELIVVADGAPDDCSHLVSQSGGTLLSIPGPSGPAVARNRGVAVAQGTVIVFVDSDVVIAPDALARIRSAFDAEPDLAAIFGAYDEGPDDPGFLSQARNLAHSFVHQRASREASTFWAGLGGVRRNAFASVDGFDERFARPSVEDIELGYRLRAAGHRILLDHAIRGKHLKHWSLWSGLRTDVRDRGIPWTQLLHRYAAMRNDLNVSHAYRLCVIVSYLALSLLVGAVWQPVLLAPAVACLLALVWLDRSYYAFFVRRKGVWFTVRWFPMHVVHHLCNGVSFALGTALYALSRHGLRCPGALPTNRWSGRPVSTRAVARSG